MIVGESKPPLSELAHFGVKGMKWGVHRDRMEATTLSKAKRKEVRKNFIDFSNQVAARKFGPDNPLGFERRVMSREAYDSLSTKDYVLRKGSHVRRITRRKDETYNNTTYVSSTQHDGNVYRAVMPSMGMFKFGGNKRYANSYELTLKATQRLASPSDKARVDAFIEMMDTPSIKLKSGKLITGRDHLKKAGFKKEVKTLDRTRLGLEFYNSMAEYQYTNNRLNTAYFNRLREKGYNSVLDDNDRGHLSQAPLILLNPNGSVKKISVKKLTADDVNNAMGQLQVEKKK